MSSPNDFKTILVLDDDPQFHKLVVPVLQNRGHHVVSAHTGKEASTIVERQPVDLLIVDGQLPDVTGIEWITNLRAAGNQALAMFVSAYWRDAQSYHKLTKELGVSLVIHKPLLASAFAAEVDMLLGKTSAYGDGASPDFEDTLLALRTEYAKELPARLGELSAMVAQMKANPDNRFLMSEARTRAHKLRGTASSYGFKELGDLAAQIEEEIVAAAKYGGSRPHFTKTLDAAVERAVAIAANAANEVEEPDTPAEGKAVTEEIDVVPANAIARILVVDDDAAFLDLVEELAREHELEVVRASSANEGLDMACMREIDAALIDVELGSRDAAFKLAGELRMLPGYRDLPLGFLSGAGHIEHAVEVDNIGHCLLFDKPTRADALDAAVRQLVAIKQAARPRVLVIDDDRDFLQRTAFVLQHEGIQVETLQSTVEILEQMQQFAPDALLLDVMMPGVSGFDICRMLRTIPRWRDLPIVFLTAYADIDTRIACLRCGGDDYLIKPVVNEELLVRLRMRLERARSLKQRLDYDNVTGLLHRRSFMEHLAGMLSEAHRHDWHTTICLVEIEDLQEGKGHLVADSVLAVAGSMLLKRLRTEDLKGRWGKDTLVLAFRDEEKAFVDALMQRVVEEFDAAQTLHHDEPAVAPKFKFGLACYPDDGASVHELFAVADNRLHGRPQTAAKQRK